MEPSKYHFYCYLLLFIVVVHNNKTLQYVQDISHLSDRKQYYLIL